MATSITRCAADVEALNIETHHCISEMDDFGTRATVTLLLLHPNIGLADLFLYLLLRRERVRDSCVRDLWCVFSVFGNISPLCYISVDE